jgi:hypothetical protein
VLLCIQVEAQALVVCMKRPMNCATGWITSNLKDDPIDHIYSETMYVIVDGASVKELATIQAVPPERFETKLLQTILAEMIGRPTCWCECFGGVN